MDYVLTIINLFLEFWLTAILVHKLINRKLVINKRLLLILVFYLIFDFSLQLILSHGYVLYLLLQLASLVLIWVFFKIAVYRCIMLYSLIYVSLVSVQFLVISVLMPFVPNVSSSATGVIGNSLTLVCVLIVCTFLPLHKVYNIVDESNFTVKSFLITGYIAFMFINTRFQFETSDYLTNIMLIGIAVIVIVFVNINMFYINSKLIVQEKIITAHNEYLPVINDVISQVRSIQHDFSNQIQTIASMPFVYDNFEDISTAILEHTHMLTIMTYPSKLLSINYKLLAALVYSKAALAKEANKNLDYNVKTPMLESKVPEHILIEIVGILLDNAFEATKENDNIYLIFDQIGDKMVIITKNVGPDLTPEFSRNMFTLGFSTKSLTGERGIGMYKLKNIVQDYKGDLTITNEIIDSKTFLCFEIVV